MRIVLATSPAEGEPWSRVMPSLGLTYLAGSVRNVPAMEVRIVDAMSEGLNAAEAIERIVSLSPDVVGVSVTSASIQRGLRLLASVKRSRPRILTISGGYHATAFDDLLLRETPNLTWSCGAKRTGVFPSFVGAF